MIIGIVSSHPALTSRFVEQLGLESDAHSQGRSFSVYKKDSIILVDADGKDVSAYRFICSEFAPDSVFFATFAMGIGNERYIGDVIFPNAFLRLHPELESSDVTKENQNEFFTESLFLEQYTTQQDYDFSRFSLSVGGISVSADHEISVTPEIIEKLTLAYEPDGLDRSSLDVVRTAKELGRDKELYVAQGLLSGKGDATGDLSQIEYGVAENVVNIVRFFAENFLKGKDELEVNMEI